MVVVDQFSDVLGKACFPRTLLVGNGFSVDFDTRFSYPALYAKARAEFYTEIPHIFDLMDRLSETNFEWMMHELTEERDDRQAKYGDADSEVQRLSQDIALLEGVMIAAIVECHPNRCEEIPGDASQRCFAFLEQFSTVFTLNYDLLMHWVRQNRLVELLNAGMDEDQATASLRQDIHELHGTINLFPVTTQFPNFGIQHTYEGAGYFLKLIVREKILPIIIAKGSSGEKAAEINRSISTYEGYGQLQQIDGALFVFGFRAAPNDEHILNAIEQSQVKQLFVGLYKPASDPDYLTSNQVTIDAFNDLKTRRPDIDLYFYDTVSAHVWR